MPKCYYDRVRPCVSAVILATPPIRCLVAHDVFDAFGWCMSTELEWRRPAGRWEACTAIDGSDPARMVFVMRSGVGAFLPRELARVHATGMGLEDEQALAPWAIDDATDELFARRQRPGDVLWLAADNLNALFWGLHDWAHFHNHGSFVQRAATELQCDAAALAWLWENRLRVPIDGAAWERVRRDVEAQARARFVAEGLPLGSDELGAERIRGLLVGEGERTRVEIAGSAATASRRVDVAAGDRMLRVPTSEKGAIGFDGNDELIAAYRGPQVHVKTRGTHDCER